MKKVITVLLLSVAVVALAGSTAQAVLITNGGATLLDAASFENDTVGAVPPSPWTTTSVAGDVVQVVNAVSPGAYHGSNYLMIQRNGTTITAATANFTAQTTGTVAATRVAPSR